MTNRPVLVVGMHRSGTSLVAGLLEGLGVHLGEPGDLLPPAPDNPRGFWEHERISSLNDRLLAELGGAWDVPPATPTGWQLDDRFGGLRAEAGRIVERLADHGTWGFKDPRTMLVADFWLDLCAPLDAVFCVRNPLEVVQSLRARNGHSAPLALRLWWTYHQRFAEVLERRATDFGEVVAVHYRTLLDDPGPQLERVRTVLGLAAGTADPVEVAADRLDRGLLHHRLGAAELSEADVDPAVAALYRHWCDLAGATGEAPEPTGTPAVDGNGSRPGAEVAPDDRVGRVDLDRLDLADLRSRYHLRGGHIALLEQRLAEAARRIVELEEELRLLRRTAATSPATAASAVPAAVAPTATVDLGPVLDRLDDLVLHLAAGGDDPAAPVAAAHRALRRLTEAATGPGARVGVLGGTDDPPADRYLTEVPADAGPELLDLLAAEGVDALAATDGPHRVHVEPLVDALGWPLADERPRVGAVWTTAPRPATLAERLADWCDEAELHSGRPASVLDLTSARHGDLLTDRVVFGAEVGEPGRLVPRSVDLVLVDDPLDGGHPAATLATLRVDGDRIAATRGDAPGRVPTVSLVLAGMPGRFRSHLGRCLPPWFDGEVLGDDDPAAFETLLDRARGEVVVAVNGTWLPRPGALAPLVDALTHVSTSVAPAGLAVARTAAPDGGVPGWVSHGDELVRPQGRDWTARRVDGPFGGDVVAASRAMWLDAGGFGRAARPSIPARWAGLAARLADDWSSVWVPESRWVGRCAVDTPPAARDGAGAVT